MKYENDDEKKRKRQVNLSAEAHGRLKKGYPESRGGNRMETLKQQQPLFFPVSGGFNTTLLHSRIMQKDFGRLSWKPENRSLAWLPNVPAVSHWGG